jgi:hypothetical protein
LPFSSDDVGRLLEAAIRQVKLGDEVTSPRIAAALAPILTPALIDLAGDGPLMTANEALFVRDAVAKELQANGGTETAERLLRAGYIDVQPILEAHRRIPDASPAKIGAMTGPLPVPPAQPTTGSSPFVPLPVSAA